MTPENGITVEMPVATMAAKEAVEHLLILQRSAEFNGLPFEITISNGYPIERAVSLLFRLMRWGSGSSNFTVTLPEGEMKHPHLVRFKLIHSGVKFVGVPPKTSGTKQADQ